MSKMKNTIPNVDKDMEKLELWNTTISWLNHFGGLQAVSWKHNKCILHELAILLLSLYPIALHAYVHHL